jgi:osmoprotectant transport system permease protein
MNQLSSCLLTRCLLTLCLLTLLLVSFAGEVCAQEIRVGSKSFTENVILGEIATQLFKSDGLDARHRSEIGGTRILWEALVSGDIDAYPEYTGTIVQEILSGEAGSGNLADIEAALSTFRIGTTNPLGFNNTYVLGMRKETAEELKIESISDLQAHPELPFGFSNEFMARGDGWPALLNAYNLIPYNVRGIYHDLGYRAL